MKVFLPDLKNCLSCFCHKLLLVLETWDKMRLFYPKYNEIQFYPQFLSLITLFYSKTAYLLSTLGESPC